MEQAGTSEKQKQAECKDEDQIVAFISSKEVFEPLQDQVWYEPACWLKSDSIGGLYRVYVGCKRCDRPHLRWKVHQKEDAVFPEDSRTAGTTDILQEAVQPRAREGV